jgi:DNA-directed RNA polymerase subunit beta'
MRRESASGIGTFLAKNIEGRYLAQDVEHDGKLIYKKGHFITQAGRQSIEDSGVARASTCAAPIGCKSQRGICAHCYGADLGTMKPVAWARRWAPLPHKPSASRARS